MPNGHFATSGIIFIIDDLLSRDNIPINPIPNMNAYGLLAKYCFCCFSAECAENGSKRSTFSALYSMKQWNVGWKSVPGGRARALLGSWRWSWRKKTWKMQAGRFKNQNELVVITQPIWKSISQINSPGRGEIFFLKKIEVATIYQKRLDLSGPSAVAIVPSCFTALTRSWRSSCLAACPAIFRPIQGHGLEYAEYSATSDP